MPLDHAQLRAWAAYIEASLRLQTLLDEALRAEAGLTLFDYHLLVVLSEAPQRRLRMSELAERMVFSRSRMTYQVNSMIKRGLVIREAAPDDGRGYRAVLTATGWETLRAAAPRHAAAVQRLFLDQIAPDELPCIERVFTRLHASLTAGP
ncbi:MarR family winged helix-turn-helix transcriptional regulator [Mycolicibacter acidiphilus]|nr:MarR family transcriptional regulator [Mycolicibacter acidiphilus]